MSINSAAWIRDYSSGEAIYGKKEKQRTKLSFSTFIGSFENELSE